MKQFIKDNKIFNSPIKIEEGKKIIISSDENWLKKYGYEVYVPKYEITIEDKIEASNEHINKETDKKILNDFIWNGNEFYLTMENQQNFANMFIAKEYLTFPQTVKTKTGYATINSKEEVTEFYLAGVNFIKQCLEEGWQRKIDMEQNIRNDFK